jgi:hypothetical protein
MSIDAGRAGIPGGMEDVLGIGRSEEDSDAPKPTGVHATASFSLDMSSTTLLSIQASRLARLHSFLSFTAFIGALLIASSLHYTKIVKNGVAGWPEEWFPSVSAT